MLSVKDYRVVAAKWRCPILCLSPKRFGLSTILNPCFDGTWYRAQIVPPTEIQRWSSSLRRKTQLSHHLSGIFYAPNSMLSEAGFMPHFTLGELRGNFVHLQPLRCPHFGQITRNPITRQTKIIVLQNDQNDPDPPSRRFSFDQCPPSIQRQGRFRALESKFLRHIRLDGAYR
jgi:hypothetical protein